MIFLTCKTRIKNRCRLYNKKTSKDYGFNDKIGNGIFIIDENIKKYLNLELSILKNWYKNSNIKKYILDRNVNEYVIYSEKNKDEDTFKKEYPAVYNHLLKYKELLIKIRLRNKENIEYWFTLDRPREKEAR